MNFGQIYETAIAQVVGLSQTEQLLNVNTEFVKRMVNKGYHIIERAALWKFSEAEDGITSAANTRAAQGVPTDLSVPLMVYSDTLKDTLHFHDERQRFFSQSDKGTVTHYSVWGNEIRFYPLPTKVEDFTLRYYKKWTDLTLDADIPVIPEAFHGMLVDYGSYNLALRIPPTGERFLPYSKAQPYLEAFERELGRMLESPLVLPTWDNVPNYDFEDYVLNPEFY